jgi:hypothetical protein
MLIIEVKSILSKHKFVRFVRNKLIFRTLFPAVKPEYVLFEWFVIIRG